MLMLSTKLIHGLQMLSLPTTTEVVDALELYLDLLEKWNAVINLTAIRERERMVTLHLLDSLTPLPWMKGAKRLLDVGSGGGMPGIPLAILSPHLEVTLLEPNQKKASFLRQVKLELNLKHVRIETQRVEQWQPTSTSFDLIISRAFSDLVEFTRASTHLLAPGGAWIAMKGGIPYEELGKLPAEVRAQSIPVQVPGLVAERHLIVLQPVPDPGTKGVSSSTDPERPASTFLAPEPAALVFPEPVSS